MTYKSNKDMLKRQEFIMISEHHNIFRVASKYHKPIWWGENTRARSTRVKQYCHFDNFVLLTSSRLDGVTSPYPRENIIAGNYILADMQAYLDKRHRQQNKEILIRHSPGIGECFLLSNIQLTEKIKKISSGGCKNASQRFVLMKGYFLQEK